MFDIMLGLFLMCVSVGLIGLARHIDKEHNKLLSQCLSDGHKEYECESLLKKCSSGSAIIPIIVPK